MVIFLVVLHVLISIALVLVILAQTSKGNGLDSNLGGAATNVFGSGASEVLRSWTKYLAIAFAVMCVVLALSIKNDFGHSAGLKSAIQREVPEQVEEVPAQETAPSSTTDNATTTTPAESTK